MGNGRQARWTPKSLVFTWFSFLKKVLSFIFYSGKIHITKFTILIIFLWHYCIHPVEQTPPPSSSRTFALSQTLSVRSKQEPHSLPQPAPGTHSIIWLCDFDSSGCRKMGTFRICPFGSGFLHSASCPQSSFMLEQVAISSLKLNPIPLYVSRILEWVATSFSRGSSQPRDWIRVSCIAGSHFNLWATREAYQI